MLTSHLDHCSPPGKETERSRDRVRDAWMSFPEKRGKTDVAFSELLQTPSTSVTECLWSGKGEILNEVLKAPESLHHPLGCQLP